jgi:hypothetical protein
MSYKPDEATMAAYFYGEVSEAEREKIEHYLEQHPEERKRLDEWSFTRKVMSGLADKEVIAPPIFVDAETAQRPIYRERYFRMTVGIAASFLFIMIAAKFLGFSASYSQGELRMGFGIHEKGVVETPVNPGLTENRVNEMIQASLASNNEKAQVSWNENRRAIESDLNKNLNSNSAKIDRFIQNASDVNREQVRRFVAQIQNENLSLMKDYMQISSTSQKEYIENLMIDFSKYLEEQRKQDLQLFQVRMNNVEENTNILKQETSEILTSLMIPGGTGDKTKRN